MVPVVAAAPAPAADSLQYRELRDVVENYVREKAESLGRESRITRYVAGVPQLPDGKLEYEIIAPHQWEGWGAVNLAVIVRKQSVVVANVRVNVDVETITGMVVAIRQISPGSVIGKDDVIVQRRPISPGIGSFATAADELVGRKVRGTIKPNQVIRIDQTEKIPLIKNGQLVTIIAENESMKVSVSGRARAAGSLGDIIPVQNLNSQREIPAKIIDSSTVLVGF